MFTQSKKGLLTAAILLALSTGTVSAADQAPKTLTEARQETQIWTTYALSPYLRANDLQVAVHEGKATLSGVVDEDVNKDLARQIALGVDGVKTVDNQIVVQADYTAPAPGAKRGYGEMVDDATIGAAVKSRLAWSKHADELDATVQTQRGVVTLAGTATTQEASDLALRLATGTRGVVSVENDLVVRKVTPATDRANDSVMDNVGQNISDGWITTKVKSSFLYSNNVSGSDISVSTAQGIVTLSGKVDSGAERALAIELAKNIRGVKSVSAGALTL